jgi:hypothetical protein
MPQAAPQLFHRAVEVVFDVSLNTQSQSPDIPDIPLRAVSSRYAVSLQTQALAPDIPLVSLYAYMEELSVSFNVQDQSPDDSTRIAVAPHVFHAKAATCTLDSQYVPRFFVDNLLQDSQVIARLHTKQVI